MRSVRVQSLSLIAAAVVLASCSDDPVSNARIPERDPQATILDAARGGQPEFYWLPPTVATAPVTQGVFDDAALAELAVQVCEIDALSACVPSTVEAFTSGSQPTPSSLTLDAVGEAYEMRWLTGRSGAKAGSVYRVTALRGTAALGYVDVQLVQNTPALAGVDTSRFTGLVAGQQFTVRFRLELPVARNYVKINEVESNNGVPGDWAELYNTNARPFDLSGYVFRDDDDTRGYTLPAGTIIPGNGYLVLDESSFGFGLGAADKARLFEPDGVTRVDEYAWTAHAVTTWGRCPDGTGAFVETSIVTRGGANDCLPLIRLNEVESSGGLPADWVELYNPAASAVSLEGYVLKDASGAQFVAPAGLTLPAGGLLVLDQSQFGFELDDADALQLYRPGGTLLVDSFSWATSPATSWSRRPDGPGTLIAAAAATKGAPNACTPPTTDVRINEVESSGGIPGDWVELVNTGSAPVDLSGYVFRDNDNTRGYVLPAGTTIAAGGYLVLNELSGGVGDFTFGLGANDEARLFAPGGAILVDGYAWTSHAVTTYGRCPSGTGTFVTSTTSTKGAANDCSVLVKINEIEGSGGVPGDWVELFNAGPAPADLSGYVFRDNNAASNYTLPAGTILAPGAYLVLDEVVNGVGNFTFGLGAADDARLFAPDGTTLIDSYSWTAHAATTYGRCPNGTGAFTTTGAPTKGASNNCGALALAVKINEVESSGGTPGDWVELFNTGSTAADLSGYVFRDNGTVGYVLPAGTIIAAGGYLVLDEVVGGVGNFPFGLGGADEARLFAPDGTTLIDSYLWTVHAATTYGRCPNGTGNFVTTQSSTKGAANDCAPAPVFSTWPGSATVADADVGGSFFGGNLSGLIQEASGTSVPGVLWAARNGPGALYRLLWNGSAWAADPANSWAAGKALRYPGGTGDVDAEGITRRGPNSIYIAAERNNAANSISRNSILLFDVSAPGTTLTATREWDLTADLPANGANLGLEGITFVPDAYLLARGFRDEATNAAYNPAMYPNHNGGLFFVGVEASGLVYGYALDHVTGGFTRVASFSSGFPGVMDLQFDTELNQLWAICDNTCQGRSTILTIDNVSGSPTQGRFIVTRRFERPTGLPDLNNEGFGVGAQAECVGGQKPVYWSDDSQTGGVSIRRGTVSCTAF